MEAICTICTLQDCVDRELANIAQASRTVAAIYTALDHGCGVIEGYFYAGGCTLQQHMEALRRLTAAVNARLDAAAPRQGGAA